MRVSPLPMWLGNEHGQTNQNPFSPSYTSLNTNFLDQQPSMVELVLVLILGLVLVVIISFGIVVVVVVVVAVAVTVVVVEFVIFVIIVVVAIVVVVAVVVVMVVVGVGMYLTIFQWSQPLRIALLIFRLDHSFHSLFAQVNFIYSSLLPFMDDLSRVT
eukprot:TRINITY_DN12459_c0_g1_i8.p2 TRINITY_DN12459_c0_g1~~TRINITY_DN12459_c0_g1_i8.p2  ORF type:complete len:158 (-),score=26.00 TRINITY_DN12459_c0_g1_i8:241-714(-)